MEPVVAQISPHIIYNNVLMLYVRVMNLICLVKVTERIHHGFYVESDNQLGLGD